MGHGLQKLCKMYGKMKVGFHGKTLIYVWDYAQEVAVLTSKMPAGSQRWKQSEVARARFLASLKEEVGDE